MRASHRKNNGVRYIALKWFKTGGTPNEDFVMRRWNAIVCPAPDVM